MNPMIPVTCPSYSGHWPGIGWDGSTTTLLHCACNDGKTTSIDLLLSLKANASAIDSNRRTPTDVVEQTWSAPGVAVKRAELLQRLQGADNAPDTSTFLQLQYYVALWGALESA